MRNPYPALNIGNTQIPVNNTKLLIVSSTLTLHFGLNMVRRPNFSLRLNPIVTALEAHLKRFEPQTAKSVFALLASLVIYKGIDGEFTSDGFAVCLLFFDQSTQFRM